MSESREKTRRFEVSFGVVFEKCGIAKHKSGFGEVPAVPRDERKDARCEPGGIDQMTLPLWLS